jgi:hypothetical protein
MLTVPTERSACCVTSRRTSWRQSAVRFSVIHLCCPGRVFSKTTMGQTSIGSLLRRAILGYSPTSTNSSRKQKRPGSWSGLFNVQGRPGRGWRLRVIRINPFSRPESAHLRHCCAIWQRSVKRNRSGRSLCQPSPPPKSLVRRDATDFWVRLLAHCTH